MILKIYVKEFAETVTAELSRKNIISDEQYVTFLFTRLCEFREPAKKLTQLHMEAMLLEAFLSMRDHFAVKTAYRDYYENCRIGAFFFIYLTWLENGCRESPEELPKDVLSRRTFFSPSASSRQKDVTAPAE